MIETRFPKNKSYGQLARAAELHAIQIAGDRGHIETRDDVPTDRLIVNYLRHECTDYDDDQTAERHKAACEAIADRFPYLAEECKRQITRRGDTDRRLADEAACYEAQQREWKAARRTRVEESKQAIKAMQVGQQVTYRRNEKCVYTATIVKVGRSKVTVAYRVKTGKDRDRTATVHAALVTPLETAAR